MSKTLYVDIDSTIWPAEVEYEKATQELFGVSFNASQWYSVPELEKRFGPDYKQIFAHALDPRRIPDRRLYPHAKRSLRLLANLGFKLFFISHNDQKFRKILDNWLQDVLHDVSFDITVNTATTLDKVDFMCNDPDSWGIIEDKPATLDAAADAGFVTIAKRQPWNTLTIVARSDILSFDSWKEIPNLIGRRVELGSDLVRNC